MVRSNTTLAEFRTLSRASVSPRLRTQRQFAEQEIVVPTGPFPNQRFRVERQPFAAMWFDAIDDPRWYECVITGPSQSGKTLLGFVIPLCYHLFEKKETVIAAVPDLDMVRDKLDQDILPVIEKTRYRDLLPTRGLTGKTKSIRLKHGVRLRFMTAGGGDKTRAAYTAKTICMTETDGFDTQDSTSEEASKIEQVEARMRSFPLLQRRIYKECTLTTKEGHTWQRLKAGTDSRIMLQCVHCKAWVSPEREDFHGWQDAETDRDAVESAAYGCPACGEYWSEADRRAANREGNAKLVYRGQEIGESGNITGDPPKTLTLSFRWSAVNNLLIPAGDVGLDEWKAIRSTKPDDAERKMRQFVWSIPYVHQGLEVDKLDAETVRKRQRQQDDERRWGRGFVPEDTQVLTVGVDLAKWLCHWVAIAWLRDQTAHIIDYGRIEVPTDDWGIERALPFAVKQFRDEICETGWVDAMGQHRIPDSVFIDCGFKGPLMYRKFFREIKDTRYRPILGRGIGHLRKTYNTPKATGKTTPKVGDHYHYAIFESHGVIVVEANVDEYKPRFQSMFQLPLGRPGSMSIFSAPANEHMSFAHHMTAEEQRREFVPDVGAVKKCVQVSDNNHWLDASGYATVAAVDQGWSIWEDDQTPAVPAAANDLQFMSPVGV